MAHFFYSAYGLSIRCNFPLPEMLPLDSEVEIDVCLDLVDFPAGERQNPAQIRYDLGWQEAEMAWPEVGIFRLEAGRRVQIEPAPDVADTTLRALLLGPVLAGVLYQRRFLVLHCSSVALRDAAMEWGALGFLGHSGEGKSTMAAALHARGARVMSDDVIAVPIPEIEAPLPFQFAHFDEARPEARPIFPALAQLRLWPQSVEALGENPEHLPLLYPHQARRVRRVDAGFETSGVPLRALFVLRRGDELQVSRLSPASALFALVEHTYVVGLRDPRAATLQFQKCGTLARTLPVFALTRPTDLSRLDQVAALVEACWHSLNQETVSSNTIS